MERVRIIVVDDFEPWRNLVASILQNDPYFHIICEAEDGLEAVQKAEELKPDLLLLDIGLPKMNGMDAGRLVRERLPESRIIFLTQEHDPDVVQQALDMGALGWVYKPLVARDLMVAIRTVLLNQSFVSSLVPGYGSGAIAALRRSSEDDANLADGDTKRPKLNGNGHGCEHKIQRSPAGIVARD